MSAHDKPNPFLTGYEGSSLVHAHFKVIDAFAIGDPKYTLKMLRVFYGATARKDIIETCEKTYRIMQREIQIATAPTGYTQHDKQLSSMRQNLELEEKVMQFYFQITKLLNEKGFTEFMKARPRDEARPTI